MLLTPSPVVLGHGRSGRLFAVAVIAIAVTAVGRPFSGPLTGGLERNITRGRAGLNVGQRFPWFPAGGGFPYGRLHGLDELVGGLSDGGVGRCWRGGLREGHLLVLGRGDEGHILDSGQIRVRDGSAAETLVIMAVASERCVMMIMLLLMVMRMRMRIGRQELAGVDVLARRRGRAHMGAAGEEIKLVRCRRARALGGVIQQEVLWQSRHGVMIRGEEVRTAAAPAAGQGRARGGGGVPIKVDKLTEEVVAVVGGDGVQALPEEAGLPVGALRAMLLHGPKGHIRRHGCVLHAGRWDFKSNEDEDETFEKLVTKVATMKP